MLSQQKNDNHTRLSRPNKTSRAHSVFRMVAALKTRQPGQRPVIVLYNLDNNHYITHIGDT